MKKILVLNGPNLNLLGKREPTIYGNQTFEDYFKSLQEEFKEVSLFYFQSNHEGALIDKIHEVGFDFDGIVINAGAYTHTSIALHDAIRANPALASEYREEYDYYPEKWVSPYIDRRRECGFGLYGVLGIGKGDKGMMHAQHQKNFRFFDAPVGLIFTIDKVMGRGSLLDYGMFLQSIMVDARSRGLHTCPQAAWNGFSKIILPHVGAGENEMVVCGMALGYADESALVNTFQTTRVSAQDFTHWVE